MTVVVMWLFLETQISTLITESCTAARANYVG